MHQEPGIHWKAILKKEKKTHTHTHIFLASLENADCRCKYEAGLRSQEVDWILAFTKSWVSSSSESLWDVTQVHNMLTF